MTLSNKRKILLGEMNWMFLCKFGSEEKDRVFTRYFCNYDDYEKYNKLRESPDLRWHFWNFDNICEIIDENLLESFAMFQAKLDFE